MHDGKILYRYTLHNGKFFIHEGVVIEIGARNLVKFKDSCQTLRGPKEEELGKIRSAGHSLWMDRRDDSYARRAFIEHESTKIINLQKEIDKKSKTIEMLMEMEEKGYGI